MRKPLALLLLLGLAGLILLAWLWRSGREAADAMPSGSAPAHAEGARATSEAAGLDLVAQPEVDEARKIAAPDAPTAKPTAAESNAGDASLSVRVIGKTNRAPVPRVRVALIPKNSAPIRLSGKRVEEASGDLLKEPLTGSDGKVEFQLPAGIDLDLLAQGEDVETGSTNLEVPRLHVGERRELVVELPQRNDARVVGKVVSAETGKPIAGARVQVLQPGEAGTEQHVPGPKDARTGGDGLFEFQFTTWEWPRLRIDAEGFGVRFANPAGGHDDLEHLLLVELPRACTLRASVVDSSGAPVAGVSVEATAAGHSLGQNDENHQGFFMVAYIGAPDARWIAQTGGDGRATIRGLPAEVELKITVAKNGKQLRQEAVALTLQAGEVKDIELRIGGGTRLSGFVLDQDGRPVLQQELWLERSLPGPILCFQPQDGARILARATTDRTGSFVFDDVPAGTWDIGPAAPLGRPPSPDANAVATVPERIELSNEPARELTLRVSRGLYIRGTVLTPKGEPAPSCYVLAVGEGEQAWDDTHSGQDGSFALGPVTSQTLTLIAHGTGKFASSDPVRARANEPGVVLRLKLAGAILGRVVDGATGIACAAQLMFAPEQPGVGPFAHGMLTSTNEDGSFELLGLEPGRFGLTAMTADGRFAQQVGVGVSAGIDTGGLELRLAPGGKLILKYAGKQPRLHATVTCSGAPVHFGAMLEAGQVATLMAPAGAIVLELRQVYFGPARPKHVALEAGQTMEIVLTDED